MKSVGTLFCFPVVYKVINIRLYTRKIPLSSNSNCPAPLFPDLVTWSAHHKTANNQEKKRLTWLPSSTSLNSITHSEKCFMCPIPYGLTVTYIQHMAKQLKVKILLWIEDRGKWWGMNAHYCHVCPKKKSLNLRKSSWNHCKIWWWVTEVCVFKCLPLGTATVSGQLVSSLWPPVWETGSAPSGPPLSQKPWQSERLSLWTKSPGYPPGPGILLLCL